ncbi:3,4-dihydroxy-2-butanone-4-phosphate synthase [Conexibacter sp. CPCC 206217]|uniref:3,4-dihydroxy-2-butanone-4-phosphate synthase n=1 Tax=Conexibacter sp. CPCC 206217 TaxID=3064574 RepID=UPI0027269DFF|nr:3,4-dihydroxy-2-butanone-4-phosphate synthase [Conexibacter sp. CPCC 206217]MDO8212052.1 3,4-dihydroxy-2-butanone-4-phosphate synthase [Conexibacter sp. CPCC 206217]
MHDTPAPLGSSPRPAAASPPGPPPPSGIGEPPTRALRVAPALADGETVVVHDDRICLAVVAARFADETTVAAFARDARGLVTVPMAPERLDALGLPAQKGSPDRRLPDFMVSVDALNGTTTGISAADRATTIQALLATAPDGRLGVPGHILPVRAAAGGTLERATLAEACVDLARIAGVEPVLAACEILDEDGEALAPEALGTHRVYGDHVAISVHAVRAHRRGLAEISVADLSTFRSASSALVSGVAAVTVRDRDGAPRGMLATSVTSYSDRPPSMLISAAHSSRTSASLISAAGFGVHVLSHEQRDVADTLASRADDKFAALDWSWDGDVPRLGGALAYLRCSRAACFAHYDHTIVIGDVELIELADTFPLVYFQRTLGWQLEHRGGS